MAAPTLTSLTNNVFLRLNEPTNSTFAQLESGGGNTAVQATTAAIAAYLDLGMAEMYRSCLLLSGKGTATLAVGQKTVAFEDLSATMDRNSAPDGSTLWAAMDVSYNGTALTYCGREAARLRFNSYYQTANSTPFYFWREANYAVSVWPPPAFTATLVIQGYCLPPSLLTSPTAVWMMPDAGQYVEMYAAIKVAELNQDDPSLYVRMGHLVEDYNMGRRDLFRKLSPTLAADLQLTEPPPLPMPQKK